MLHHSITFAKMAITLTTIQTMEYLLSYLLLLAVLLLFLQMGFLITTITLLTIHLKEWFQTTKAKYRNKK